MVITLSDIDEITNSSLYNGSVPVGLIAIMSPICQPLADSTFKVF